MNNWMNLLGFVLLLLIPSSSLADEEIEETVNVGQVRCGKVNYKCKMMVTYTRDCAQISKVTPMCTPPRSKCRGVQVSFITTSGCTVTRTYKNYGKKQTMSKLTIAGSSCDLLQNTKNTGNAFANFSDLENPRACANLCARTSSLCISWTMNSETKECFLFNSGDNLEASSQNFISGNEFCGCLLQLDTINNAPAISPGLDNIGPLRDFQDCADLCAKNQDCSFWSMKKASGICSLKQSQSELTGAVGFVSGNMRCGIDSTTPE